MRGAEDVDGFQDSGCEVPDIYILLYISSVLPLREQAAWIINQLAALGYSTQAGSNMCACIHLVRRSRRAKHAHSVNGGAHTP